MHITINGNPAETSCTSLFALKQEQNLPDGAIIIVNGYQPKGDVPLPENAFVHCIEKGKLPPPAMLEQMLMARHTPGVYKKVKRARVAIAGLGGLGSAVALSLARTGVGHLHLVDFDEVEPSNLNRQQYRICHLGMPKAEALRREISEINPYVSVAAECVRVTEENAAALFADDHILCEAFDDPDAKAALVNAILEAYPGMPVVAASGMAGYESSNTIVTRRAAGNLYLCGDGETGAEIGRGLMSPRVSVCAGHQANMVLRLILGHPDP